APADRAHAVLHELAIHLHRHGRARPRLDSVVAARILSPGGAPEAGRPGARRAPVRPRRAPGREGGAGLAPAPAVPADVGPRHREVPERRRVVLLSVLAAEVP